MSDWFGKRVALIFGRILLWVGLCGICAAIWLLTESLGAVILAAGIFAFLIGLAALHESTKHTD